MSEWDEEFKCWNTDEPILPRKRWTRFCEMCGANKPVENHELWCPNEPDRLFKDDKEFWLGRNDDECCECDVCLDERPATEWSATNLRQEYVSGGWAGGVNPIFDPEGVGPQQAATDEHNSHINRILSAVNTELTAKYHKGQAEHGGQLWKKPGMLDHAIEEVLDLIVYLYTLREQQRGK